MVYSIRMSKRLGGGRVPLHRVVVCWLELRCNYVSAGKLAASVPLAPSPCALQMTQRNQEYEAWLVSEGRLYWSRSCGSLGCINNK